VGLGVHFGAGADACGNQAIRELDAGCAIALGNQAGFKGGQCNQLCVVDLKLGLRLGVVQHQQHIVHVDTVAILHANLADHAAFQVLNELLVRTDCHRA
jgi:hypothetical protein